MTEESIDAAAVVAEIEATVARRRAAGEYPEELLRRLSVEFNPAEEDAPELLAVVGTPRPIASRRRVLGPAVVFAKRTVRRLLSWYVQPVATDQTRFNLALLREFRRVEREVDRLRTVWPSDDPNASNGVTSSAAVQPQVAAIASALAQAAAPVLVAGSPTSVIDGITAALPDREVIRCADPLEALETAAPQTIGAIVLAGVLQRMAPGELLAILPAAMAALRPGGVRRDRRPRNPPCRRRAREACDSTRCGGRSLPGCGTLGDEESHARWCRLGPGDRDHAYRMRVCFITPRFGAQVVGGAERQVMWYSQRLAAAGNQVTVLTTCATDHLTWTNTLAAGDSMIDGVLVRRFPVTHPSDRVLLARWEGALAAGFRLPSFAQEEWILNKGHSEPLLDAVADAAGSGAVLVFSPYLFATTVFGARVRPDRSIIIPCLHDEPYARFGIVQDTMRMVAGLIFNTAAEERVARGLIGSLPPHRVVGAGFDLPARIDPAAFRARRRLHAADLVAYVGRREVGKNFPMLLEYVYAYDGLLSPESPVTLVLMGSGDYDLPRSAAGLVRDLGFVADQEMFEALAASIALVNLSCNESFSHVLAQAWSVGTPVIVHADALAPREHCEKSGGGLWVDSVEMFAASLDRLRGDSGASWSARSLRPRLRNRPLLVAPRACKAHVRAPRSAA